MDESVSVQMVCEKNVVVFKRQNGEYDEKI